MLKVRSLTAGYGSLRVLKNISLHVNPGEIVTLIGANGAGKTTLLMTLAGVISPFSGMVSFFYADVTHLRSEKIVDNGCWRISAYKAEPVETDPPCHGIHLHSLSQAQGT